MGDNLLNHSSGRGATSNNSQANQGHASQGYHQLSVTGTGLDGFLVSRE